MSIEHADVVALVAEVAATFVGFSLVIGLLQPHDPSASRRRQSMRSVAELGLLTSLTMVCCLIADLVVLPAQIVFFSRRDEQEAFLLHVNGGLIVASGEWTENGIQASRVVDADLASLPERANRVQASPSGRTMIDVPLSETLSGTDLLSRRGR